MWYETSFPSCFSDAFTACDLGLGTGIFQALKVTHLIPAIRLEVCYLEKLVEGTTYSETILYSFREQVPTITLSWPRKFLNGCRRLSLSSNARRLEDASRRGFDRAMRELNEGS